MGKEVLRQHLGRTRPLPSLILSGPQRPHPEDEAALGVRGGREVSVHMLTLTPGSGCPEDWPEKSGAVAGLVSQ